MLRKIVIAIVLIIMFLFMVDCFLKKPIDNKQAVTTVVEYTDLNETLINMNLDYWDIEDGWDLYDLNGEVHHFVELKVRP